MSSKFATLAASLLGLIGVALGAFGAHALRATLEAAGQTENWKTAVFYQLIHAVALLSANSLKILNIKTISILFLGGSICFSGSLYWLALGGPIKVLWPITPLGGLMLLAGWAILGWSAIRQKS